MALLHCIGIVRAWDESLSTSYLALSLKLSGVPYHCKAYMVLGLNTVCDVYFAGAIDLLCDAWSLTPDVAGVSEPQLETVHGLAAGA